MVDRKQMTQTLQILKSTCRTPLGAGAAKLAKPMRSNPGTNPLKGISPVEMDAHPIRNAAKHAKANGEVGRGTGISTGADVALPNAGTTSRRSVEGGRPRHWMGLGRHRQNPPCTSHAE
jgi:hypothetical protein